LEGNGHGLIEGTLPEFAWRNSEEARKISGRIAGLLAEI
jgi:hypothetical protein